MRTQIHDRLIAVKKVFFVLLVLDLIEMVLSGIALFPTFRTLAGYGQPMLTVSIVMIALMAAVLLFEIFAKMFLIRSASPAFFRSTGRKGCTVTAKFLWLFNLGAAIVCALSFGGEGATLLNQTNLYLRMVSSVAEVVVVVCYLRTVKKLFKEINQES